MAEALRASPGLYGRSENADQVSSTEINVIHFRSSEPRMSQPLSRVRSVWILEQPLGKKSTRWNGVEGLHGFRGELFELRPVLHKDLDPVELPVSDEAAGLRSGKALT